MKRVIKITTTQLKKILATGELPKYPMILKGLSKEEFFEISKILNKKK